jgi:hypothetical protein
MKRETGFILIIGFFTAIASPVFAQDNQNRPSPVQPSSILGPQLIVWSEMQKPEPIPQPVPTPRQTQNSERTPEQPVSPSVQKQNTDAIADQNRSRLSNRRDQ